MSSDSDPAADHGRCLGILRRQQINGATTGAPAFPTEAEREEFAFADAMAT